MIKNSKENKLANIKYQLLNIVIVIPRAKIFPLLLRIIYLALNSINGSQIIASPKNFHKATFLKYIDEKV